MKKSRFLQNALGKSKLYLTKASPTILTCLGAIGVVATAVAAHKATLKAIVISRREGRYDKVPSGAVRCYIPVIIVGASTIACIFGANALNKRQIEALTSAYILMHGAFEQYKKKTKELLGEDADIQIRSSIIQDKYGECDISVSATKKLFYEEHYGKFFESSEEAVLLAEYHLNRNLMLRGYANLNELYSFLDLPNTEAGDILGWSLYAGGAFYGYSWVDFEHRKIVMDDGLECCMIEMPFTPTADYMDY